MNLTEEIKIICAKRKISMSELAVRTGQSQPNLANKLRRNDFKTSELEKIAAALGSRLEIRFVDNATGQPLVLENENLLGEMLGEMLGEISSVVKKYKTKIIGLENDDI